MHYHRIWVSSMNIMHFQYEYRIYFKNIVPNKIPYRIPENNQLNCVQYVPMEPRIKQIQESQHRCTLSTKQLYSGDRVRKRLRPAKVERISQLTPHILDEIWVCDFRDLEYLPTVSTLYTQKRSKTALTQLIIPSTGSIRTFCMCLLRTLFVCV